MTQTLTPTQKHTHGLLSVVCCPLTFKKKHTHGLLSVDCCPLTFKKKHTHGLLSVVCCLLSIKKTKMKKLYKLLLICLLTIAGGGNALKAQDKAYETPTLVNGYYEISKADHLFWFAATVNSGTAPINAVLTNDINLGNTSWTPIGSLANPYSGHFDGQGYTISGLNINGVFSWEPTASNGTNAGLFGSINNAGIHNLTVSGSNTATVSTNIESSSVSSGLLVGHMTDAIVYNCFANGTVTSSGYQSVGGLVGTAQHSIIINCGSEAAVTIETTVLSYSIGGLVGYMTAGYDFPLCLLNSWCTGNVTTGEHGNVGGLVGILADDAVNNYYSGTLSANKDDNVGQLFGYVYNKIRVSPDDEEYTTFTPVIEKNYYKSGTAVGFVEEGMNDTGFVETYSDMESLCQKMNSNLPLINGIIEGHRGYLSTTQWAALVSLLNGEDVRAFHWFNNGTNLYLKDEHDFVNGICSVCKIKDHDCQYSDNFCTTCGSGEPAELVNGYYEIYNAGNLFWFANLINTVNKGANAILMNDIDLENRPWTPIGTTGESSHNFRGHFDGNGKTITGLNVEVTRNGGGFFGEVRLGTVEDFTIYGEVKLNGNHSYVGGVIGSAPGANSDKPEHNGATIRNITSYVNVTLGEGSHGSNHVAGFIGYANHETLIENCTWYGTLDLDAYRAQDGVGGLVGKILQNSAVTIRNCAAYGTIKTSYQSGSYSDSNNVPFNNIFIGGIVSNSVENAQTTLENCIWAGTLINNTNLGDNAHISAIGTLNGSKSVTNCYALDNMPYITTNNAHDTGITEVTAEQLASGEIAYKLQGTQATQIWGQNIDNGETADSKPILGGAKVYGVIYDGGGIYSNTNITAGGKCGDNLYWNIDDENTLTIFGTGAMYDYGANNNNKAPWRSLNTAPKSLVLEEGITYIGNYAFYNCKGFKGSLTIPNSVTTIGEYAFAYCSGFNGSLTIPNSVTSIGSCAFDGCSGFTGDLTIPNNVTTIKDHAFAYCSGFTGSLTIPNSVTTIGEYAFCDCEGFNGYLTIGNSVTTIGEYAFGDCEGFNGSLTIPNSVTSIADYAFVGCSGFTGSLTIPNSVTSIGNYAFFGCYSFNGSLTIPNSVTYIGDYAFYKCSSFKGSLTIPNSVTTIGNYAFQNCSGFNGSLTIGNSVTSIGREAFYNCKGFNGSLTIPNSVTSIGEYAFAYCSGFNGSLTIPNSVTSIGREAFYNCKGFTEIFFYRDTNPTIGTGAFSSINANAKFYAPVIWSSYIGIPSSKLVKMATFVGQQSTDNGQQSSSTGWVGLAEGQTWPDEDDHVAINASLVLGQQTTDNGQQSSSTEDNGQQTTDNRLWVKSFGYCGDGTTVNGSITIEDGGQLYCEVARGEVTVKKDIIGYAETTRLQDNETTSETVWYTIASPLKDTLLISDPQFLNSSVPQFLSSNSDLYRYDEPSYTWQNAKNSANNGFNTIDPGRGYLYANAEDTTLEFKGDINTETVTYNLTAKSDVLNGFHLVGNPFTHDIYLESIKTKKTQNIIFELNDSYGDGWNGAALNLSFSDETPDKIITIESGNSKTETIKNVASGVKVTVSFTKGSYPRECSFTIKYDDETVICDKYSNDGSLTSVDDGATLTTFTVREVMDVLANGYYTLTGEGAWAAEASTTEAIKPMQGILVKSLVDDYELPIFNISRQPSAVSRQRSGIGQQTTDNGQQSLCISVSNAKYSDRAFVVFDKGVGLDKMNHENENIPLLYIPMEDADYAIAMMDINVNEIPVNFETNVMGEYTISLRQENCEFDELYLLDKETDEKVNILEQDYTFIATSSENPERFILMKDNGQQTTDNRPWVYVNNGDIVIYNIEGDADIKIFDALGRCVYQGESSDETTRIANGYSSGVYMIQKVDDKGVNVQKIIL